MHKMGLAEAHAPKQKQRVKRHAVGFRDPPRCGMGELVGPPDDEIFENEPRIEQRPNVFGAGHIASVGVLELAGQWGGVAVIASVGRNRRPVG